MITTTSTTVIQVVKPSRMAQLLVEDWYYQDQNVVSEQTSAQRQYASTFTTTYIIYIQDYETILYLTNLVWRKSKACLLVRFDAEAPFYFLLYKNLKDGTGARPCRFTRHSVSGRICDMVWQGAER